MRVIRLEHTAVNFTYTTDWHLSDIPPGVRAATYAQEIMGKVRFVSDLTHKIKGVGLCGGDFFHQKSPWHEANSWAMVNRLSPVLYNYPTHKVYGAVGNHDIWNDQMDSLPKQPLGNLIANHRVHDLTADPVIFESEDGSVRVLVEAYPYEAEDTVQIPKILNAAPRPEGVQYRVAILHQYGNPGMTATMHDKPTIGWSQLADSDYDVILWGHDHSRQETRQVGNPLHIRLGSLSRASLDGDQVDRPISAAVLSFTAEKLKYQEKEIPVTPLEIAFAGAGKGVGKVRKSDEVLDFFAGMDAAIGDTLAESAPETNADLSALDEPAIEGSGETSQLSNRATQNDPRTVLRTLCPKEETKIFDLACGFCGL
jgi:predicted phosphodiesterase